MPVDAMAQSLRTIMPVGDDREFRWATGNVLEAAGYRVFHAADGNEALGFLEMDIPHLVLLDYRMPGLNGLEVAMAMRQQIPAVPIVMITAYAEIDSAVVAMKMGVYDYVTKPLDNHDLLFTIQRALEKQDLMQEVAELRAILNERISLHQAMGKSDAIRKLIRHVEKVAPTSFTVLIEGESGTGKELLARSIHNVGKRREGPFVAVDCGAIPETLIESELFGYMKGAFTDAHTDREGHFERANRGTLFLDEVGNLPYPFQQKLLRVIQERAVHRLGGKKSAAFDVRIIAATNQSLEKDVTAGRFRPDLYFRLNEFTVRVPSLRERKEDIPYLAKKFMDEAADELKKSCGGFSMESLIALAAYHWPGNVRELRNVIRQAVLLCEKDALVQPRHITFASHEWARLRNESQGAEENVFGSEGSLHERVKSYVSVMEKKAILDAMACLGGNKSRVAKKLKIDYKTLLRKIKAYGMA